MMIALALLAACPRPSPPAATPEARAEVFVTSRAGDAMAARPPVPLTSDPVEAGVRLTVHVDRPKQTFLGVGGSLTQASAAALSELPAGRRAEVLGAYFGPDGAGYALSRTHIGSSDFSTYSYTYAPEPDPTLAGFSVAEDERNGLLDLIRDAQRVPGASFDLVASPWTAPAWMKDNGKLYDPSENRGGTLLREHHDTFARYLVAYLRAYAERGVDVWAVTPVNEPQGNAGSWESMEMSPEQQRDFVGVLSDRLEQAGLDTHILIFDQNRAEMAEYTEVVLGDEEVASHVLGTAVHWYNSTFRVYEDVLDEQHARYPDKIIVHSEGTIDSVAGEASCEEQCPNPPCGCEELFAWWQDDGWYWEKNATDWGWDWSPDREDHPKYAPAFRYARDLVVGMDHWLAGWIDWNIVLDRRGGPNHVGNWCLAPVMVDGETETVYYTPLYWILRQFSRHARPGGTVLVTELDGPTTLHASAILNPDGRVAVHVFNESAESVTVALDVGGRRALVTSPPASLETIVLPR